MPYLFDDEDNAPMNSEVFDRIDQAGHNPTVYSSYAEMREMEKNLPFAEPPENGCWNCLLFDYGKEACSKDWKHADPGRYNPETDDRKPTDYCEYWQEDKDACWGDWFDELRLP